jgi:probable F420-dependent oxidoreductase
VPTRPAADGSIRICLRLFGFPLTEYRDLAVAAEEAGFSGLWVPDHVVSPTSHAAAYPYSTTGRPSFSPDTPFADPIVMLAHLAAVTRRIELGVGVYVLPLRHPLHAARAIMSAQVLSGGRVLLGVGVGWMREEFEAVEMGFDQRGARTEEMVDVMRSVWTGRPVEHAGRHYAFDELQLSPAIPTPVPILWGGASSRAIDRAVRFADGWYGPPGSIEATTGLVHDLRRKLDAAGRDPAGFRVVARCPEPTTRRSVEALRDNGIRELVVNVPRDLGNPAERQGWVHAFAEQMTAAGLL